MHTASLRGPSSPVKLEILSNLLGLVAFPSVFRVENPYESHIWVHTNAFGVPRVSSNIHED